MMNIQDLRRVLISFADNESDILIERGRILATIRGEFIDAEIIDKDGELFIAEDNVEFKAIQWIADRLALLHQLADRIEHYLPRTSNYISPTGNLLRDIEIDPSETEIHEDNLTECLKDILGKKIVGTTGVVYLTSDAGEGKTTIINQVASEQARLFMDKKSKWLLVPIPLGGRPFLRFDDIVIASLVNRLRFRYFYYESFIELIKLGLIVPAFDGFEEMFMESSTGEALSATGQLMSKLNSSGNILIAARKAYFDYKNFSTQAKLLDTIGQNSVAFSKVSINRWNRSQFLEYAKLKGILNGSEIYETVEKRLGQELHPLLTRPVLVNQLLDVANSGKSIEWISETLENSATYFLDFVDAIIRREAEEKWIDRSGEPFKPLLTVEQHYELLALVAEEMWLNNTDSLHEGILDVIAEVYGETYSFPILLIRQIKERLKQHALIVKSDLGQNQYRFDHDEFKEFFLGVAAFNYANSKKLVEFKNLLRKGILFKQSIETAVIYWRKKKPLPNAIVSMFNSIQKNEGPTSFVKENSGNLILKLLDKTEHEILALDYYNFSPNSLIGLSLNDLTFGNCHFQSTSIEGTSLESCTFKKCNLDSLEIDSDHIAIDNCLFEECIISSVQNRTKETNFYDPINIEKELRRLGFKFLGTELPASDDADKDVVYDEDLSLVEKALRKFLRGTYINDTLFRVRLAQKADYFIKTLLPVLLDSKILIEVDYQGSGQKRRFKLGVPMEKISTAFINSNGEFQRFVSLLTVKN